MIQSCAPWQPLRYEVPLYSAGLKFVLVDAAKDNSIWKLCMESDLSCHGLWPLCSVGLSDAKAKRLLMQHLSNDIIGKEGLADAGCALWDKLVVTFKVQRQEGFQNAVHTRRDGELELKQGKTIDALWFRTTVLRSGLKDLGYECIDTSIVHRIYWNLKLRPAWETAVYHLSKSVSAVNLAKFNIQLQLGEPLPVMLAHMV